MVGSNICIQGPSKSTWQSNTDKKLRVKNKSYLKCITKRMHAQRSLLRQCKLSVVDVVMDNAIIVLVDSKPHIQNIKTKNDDLWRYRVYTRNNQCTLSFTINLMISPVKNSSYYNLRNHYSEWLPVPFYTPFGASHVGSESARRAHSLQILPNVQLTLV